MKLWFEGWFEKGRLPLGAYLPAGLIVIITSVIAHQVRLNQVAMMPQP